MIRFDNDEFENEEEEEERVKTTTTTTVTEEEEEEEDMIHEPSVTSEMDHEEEEEEAEEEEKDRKRRVRKSIEKFSYEVKEKKEFKVEEGPGIQLGDMDGIVLQLSRLKANDIVLTTLHRIFFHRTGKRTTMRKNIRSFSGFPGDSDTVNQAKQRAKDKLDKMTMALLKRLYDTLLIDRSAKSFASGKIDKESMVKRALEWMTNPTHPQRDAPQKRRPKAKKKTTKRKKKKKVNTGPKRALSAYMYFCADVRAKVTEEHPDIGAKEIMTKLGTMWKALGDEDKVKYNEQAAADKERYQEELQASTKRKRTTPKKKKSSGPAPKKKKRRVVVESDDSDDSDDDLNFQQIQLRSKLIAMLKDPKLDKATMTVKKLKKALQKEMGVDLSGEKQFIRQVVTDFLSS